MINVRIWYTSKSIKSKFCVPIHINWASRAGQTASPVNNKYAAANVNATTIYLISSWRHMQHFWMGWPQRNSSTKNKICVTVFQSEVEVVPFLGLVEEYNSLEPDDNSREDQQNFHDYYKLI